MVRIRLRRMGARKKPFYRIVVADKRSPRDGRFIETIGSYNPLTEPETVTLKHVRAAYWLGQGAQPSEAVARLLRKAELLDDAGKPIPYEEEPQEAPAETEEAPETPAAEDATTQAEADAVDAAATETGAVETEAAAPEAPEATAEQATAQTDAEQA